MTYHGKSKEELIAEIERLKEDKARLDYLDEANLRLNAEYGTNYGWGMVMNHNVNRLFLKDVNTLDLKDSHGGYYKHRSCRDAIDCQRDQTAWEREKLKAVQVMFSQPEDPNP